MELAYREHRLGESDVFAETWLPLLEAGDVGLQVCPIYVDFAVQPEGALREALSLVTSFHRALAESPARTAQVRTAADLDSVERGQRVGLMLALEGVECFGLETWPADLFFELGVRMAGLTWNRRNAFADGAAEEATAGSRGSVAARRPARLARGDPRPRARVARDVRRRARAGGRRAGAVLAWRLPRRTRRATEPRRRPASRAASTQTASSG